MEDNNQKKLTNLLTYNMKGGVKLELKAIRKLFYSLFNLIEGE
jgi:hypothetical protein